ncbi:MAG: DUF1415 domain-containing protein [Planctomycetaceae bacterium]|nr:MAG: DUF1415 domain-containing protein [Planctomycetaceae bacterium]
MSTPRKSVSPAEIAGQVDQWLEQVVIGLNLCPFAGVPYRDGRIRITVSHAASEPELLHDLEQELTRLAGSPPAEIETTLLVVADLLADFDDYNQFLDEVDALLERTGWEGTFQVASFHPQYQFAGTQPEDPGNLTNRAPWPILHLLREDSVEQALADYPEIEAIPERNIARMESLSVEERQKLFPWLPDQ